MEVKWIKITTDIFDNRKIKYIRNLREGDTLCLIWIMLLTIAGRCNDNGRCHITEDIAYTPKTLAEELGVKEATMTRALDTFAAMKMISNENGIITVIGWEEYQNEEKLQSIREQNRRRTAESRERQKAQNEEECNAECNADVTLQDRYSNVTEPLQERYTTVTETLQDRYSNATEEERRKENKNSLFLSRARACEKAKILEGEGRGRVKLTDDEFADLKAKLSADELRRYVGIIADCEESGKRFKKKTHHQAILDMATADRKKAKPNDTYSSFDTEEFIQAALNRKFQED